MAVIKYISHQGTETEIDVAAGMSVMQGAYDNDINGILAECGGACSCATCHVYVDDAWVGKVPAADDMEQSMIQIVPEPRENSRLSCQLRVTADMDGLVVRMPETQT